MSEVRTTCPYCGVGCGVRVRHNDNVAEVAGDEVHPANRGRLCSKGLQLGATLDASGPPRSPRIGGRDTSWDEALDTVAGRFAATVREHGPDAVAFYISGQLLTEDYYVANKLMKGAIGSANIDTNSRLCMASAVAGYTRAFGADVVPCGYDDVDGADLVVLVGSNLAWCHPVLYRRIEDARAARGGPAVVVIDPRETPTAADADLHLPIRPGMDAALFNGLLAWLDDNGHVERKRLCSSTEGFAEALLAARADGSPGDIADRCGLRRVDLLRFYELFAATAKTVTIFSQGVNQSAVGTDKVNAIVNAHLATGRIGMPGAGPFSITGQPNAMGGREVGGLASQLAAHMDFTPENVDRLRRFWGFDRVADRPGLTAVPMFEAIARGDIKAVWIMGTNPAVSMPRAGDVRKALAACDFVVVSDCVADTDTIRFADVLLPANGWGAKDGTVTNSERCISRQRAFLCDDDGARADWRIVSQVASRMGFAGQFDYRSSADVFREHAALSAFENDGRRAFDIGALSDIDDAAYDAMEPTYWPCPAGQPGTTRPGDLFRTGRYFTPSRKARLVPARGVGTASDTSETYPLLLNTGRVRDQWHTMTRTGLAPRLNRHSPEPALQMHPLDARAAGVDDGQIARVDSRHGRAQFRVRVTQRIQAGQAFVPMHWSDRYASSAVVGALIEGACDPHSGQPELKGEPVAVRHAGFAWHGLSMQRDAPADGAFADAGYRVRSRFEHCVVDFLAFAEPVEDWVDWATASLKGAPLKGVRFIFPTGGNKPDPIIATGGNKPDPIIDPDTDELLVREVAGREVIVARVCDDRLQGLFIASTAPRHRDAGWLARLFAEEPLSANSRRAVVRGTPARRQAGPESGETICACVGTSGGDIEAAMEDGLGSAAAVGSATGAGTRCGSCAPEIRRLTDGG